MINGNVDGVKNFVLKRLETIYDMKFQKSDILTEELAELLKEITLELEREISVAIDRKGNVVSVAVGDSSTVEVPMIDTREGRLSQIRVIHTHPNGNPRLSALDLSALLKLKLDCIVAIGVAKDKPLCYDIGFCDVIDNILVEDEIHNVSTEMLLSYKFLDKVKYIEDILKGDNVHEDNTERAILVSIEDAESLEELKELTKACDVVPVYEILQKRNKIDSAFFIGSGKVEEIAYLRQSLRANVVIFDEELSGSQVRNLEQAIGTKVIDRTTLILEIFARRARSKESKIQVELSQLKYRLSRLGGLGTMLSRTGGGIGTKGPGEKKLETDKRKIRDTIYDLNKELEKIKGIRATQRERRSKESISKISLVGYTNAGKSTLRNALCDYSPMKSATVKEKVFEADMLFATLDITTRAMALPDNRVATVTDTVGFIRKLPHDLVEAFKSTLEEVIYSDLLLHVVDASNESAEKQITVVEEVLSELGAGDKPTVLLLNKIDNSNEELLNSLKERFSNYNILEVSAKYKTNFEELLNTCTEILPYKLKSFKVLVPYNDSSAVAYLHRNAMVESEEYVEEGTVLMVQGDDEVYNKSSKYIVEE
ncbi:GTPase HflX [Clostridium sp.]|uniref:GTPase HflX n=1 Tax=Clostridium sp. TaxID=1506 RepID=UPI0032172964